MGWRQAEPRSRSNGRDPYRVILSSPRLTGGSRHVGGPPRQRFGRTVAVRTVTQGTPSMMVFFWTPPSPFSEGVAFSRGGGVGLACEGARSLPAPTTPAALDASAMPRAVDYLL